MTEAVRYCATVSENSATDYPTQAIDACGAGRERYISACSCLATDCPIETTRLGTAMRHTTSAPTPSSSLPVLPEATSETGSKATLESVPPLTTSPSGPTGPSTSGNGPGGLSVGIVATIAVGATLIALLLPAIAVFCCLKRRRARRGARLRALALSREGASSTKSDASSERKPPVVHPPQSPAAIQVELEDSHVFRAQLDDASAVPGTPRTLSAMSSTPGAPSQPSLVELFVVPVELPGPHKG